MATEKRLIELDSALLVTVGESFTRPLPEHDEVLLATVRKKLRNLPYVDAVEVVRCKDCKHTRKKSTHEQFMYNENVCICTKEDIWGITKNEPVWDDWFCSSGERKDND